eukprot:scaffold331355_cov28-Prasinocladus_malaysianus.AAC.2
MLTHTTVRCGGKMYCADEKSGTLARMFTNMLELNDMRAVNAQSPWRRDQIWGRLTLFASILTCQPLVNQGGIGIRIALLVPGMTPSATPCQPLVNACQQFDQRALALGRKMAAALLATHCQETSAIDIVKWRS